MGSIILFLFLLRNSELQSFGFGGQLLVIVVAKTVVYINLELDQTTAHFLKDMCISRKGNSRRRAAVYTQLLTCFLPYSELKDIRQYAMSGVVHIVLPAWVEECTRQGREVDLSPQFIVPEAHLLDPSYWKPGLAFLTSHWRPSLLISNGYFW